ncbi:hypothetical protein KI387_022276, partial [Taxus chinensis]
MKRKDRMVGARVKLLVDPMYKGKRSIVKATQGRRKQESGQKKSLRRVLSACKSLLSRWFSYALEGWRSFRVGRACEVK